MLLTYRTSCKQPLWVKRECIKFHYSNAGDGVCQAADGGRAGGCRMTQRTAQMILSVYWAMHEDEERR